LLREVKSRKVENVNRSIYRVVLYSVKVIPIVISGIYVLNTVLSYFGYDTAVLSHTVHFLFICGLYTLSKILKFCVWHRVFIYYIFTVFILNIIDYHIGLPFSDRNLFLLYSILFSLALFFSIYLKYKCKK